MGSINVGDIRSGVDRLQRDIQDLDTRVRSGQRALKALEQEVGRIRSQRVSRAIQHSIDPRRFLMKERRLRKALREIEDLKHSEKQYRSDIQHKKQDFQTLYNLQRQAERGDEHALLQAQSLMSHI